jgi:hypothetical protein
MRAIISDIFRLELLKRRAAGARVYQIAAAAKVRPNELSGIAGGSIAVRHDDPRVLRVAKLLGLTPTECFAAGEGQHVA